MIKHFINSLILISFLAVFSIDSISPFFSRVNGAICELADLNDNEDNSEEEINKMESEAILACIPDIEMNAYFLSCKNSESHFFAVNSYTLKIPTPPPEYNF